MAPRLGFCARLLLAITCLVIAAAPAPAQTSPPTDRAFSPQTFHPAVGPDEFLTVEPARPLPHLNFSLGLWTSYARAPFFIFNVENDVIGDPRAQLVRDLIGADLVFALGILDRFQIGVGVPATLYQAGEDFTYSYQGGPPQTLKAPSGFALGDPWLDVKARLVGRDRGLNLALGVRVTAPANQLMADRFGGDKSFGAGGRVLVGWEADRWRAGLQVGFHWRAESAQLFSTTVGSELRWGAAIAYDVLARLLTLVAEAYGRTDVSGTSITSASASGAEVDVAAKLRLARPLLLTVGGGAGIGRGTGTPLARAFLGITFSPDLRDRDRDGVPDADDKCPDTAEDKDGFQDGDGCPEADNDGDGIADVRDKCPDQAEDFDQFDDEDGCPDPDNDGDGVTDLNDACPHDREDAKPPRPGDGCPLDKTDSDGDGIADMKDRCPTEPEDRDSFQDDDGCPDPDNDQDGYADRQDRCPVEAEDFDQFEDDDGCPDPDNDRDGVLDDADKCPTEPETINGYKDDDGCPDKGPAPKVQLVGDEILILDKVYFDTNKATIQARSFNLLEQVAATVRAHPELREITIEGHTDSQGGAAKNKVLSQNRAESVKKFLVARGVEAGRLVPVGFGPDRPVADNRTAKGREANRRVEFHITRRDKPAPRPLEAPQGDKE